MDEVGAAKLTSFGHDERWNCRDQSWESWTAWHQFDFNKLMGRRHWRSTPLNESKTFTSFSPLQVKNRKPFIVLDSASPSVFTLFARDGASESHNLCWCVNKKLITCNINFLVRRRVTGRLSSFSAHSFASQDLSYLWVIIKFSIKHKTKRERRGGNFIIAMKLRFSCLSPSFTTRVSFSSPSPPPHSLQGSKTSWADAFVFAKDGKYFWCLSLSISFFTLTQSFTISL